MSIAHALATAGLAITTAVVPVDTAPAQGSIDHDPAAKTITMCGSAYCGVVHYGKTARISSLSIDGREVLDRTHGIFSLLRTESGTVTSLDLPTDPEVAIDGETVTLGFDTSLAHEDWTFDVQDDRLRFGLRRTYSADTSLVEQGTPIMTFAEHAFDNLRWTEDGGNFPLGGALANAHQPSWLATGDAFDGNIRTVKEQLSYTFLDRQSTTALTVSGSSNHDEVLRGRASELRRSAREAGKDLDVRILTAAQNLEYAGGNEKGYWVQSTKDGTPVFKPVSVKAQQVDEVTLDFRSDRYESFYDLGTLRGVDEDALSQAINNYARWMMQDKHKGASTEQPQLQAEVPPLEMHHIGEMLELFPEEGSIRSFQAGLEDIRDHLVQDSGRVVCCAPPGPDPWGVDYGDHASGYVLGVVKAYQLTGDREWLAGMKDSLDRAMNYILSDWTDPTTRFVRNLDPTLDESRYNNDYWESSTGEFNGYTSALLYDALTSWSRLEGDVLGDPTTAERFAREAATLREHFNADTSAGGFWSPESQTFLYGSKNMDARYLPVNAQVLKTDITTPARRKQITEAIQRQNAEGNYDLPPMNVADLFKPGVDAPTLGKLGENGGWYGAPDGEFYAGLPTLGDPQVLQTAIASFLNRYRLDGFHGASTWDRRDPRESVAAAAFFPTSVLPAWGLYHYGYGFQPYDDRLILAPAISWDMVGSTVSYQWRGVPLEVAYESPLAFRISPSAALTTPVTVRWIGQEPGTSVTVDVNGSASTVKVDEEGTASYTLPSGTASSTSLACRTCREPPRADADGSTNAFSSYDSSGAQARGDVYGNVYTDIGVDRKLELTRLGRYAVSGNTGVHRVKLLDGNDRVVASAPVDMSAKPDADGFVYTTLAEPITIEPGQYRLTTVETPGGDEWYDGGTLSPSEPVTVLTPVHGPATFSYRVPG